MRRPFATRGRLPLTPGLPAVTRGGWVGFWVLLLGDVVTLARGRGNGLVLYWVAALGYAVAGNRAGAASPGRVRTGARDGATAAMAAYALTVPLRLAGHSGVSAVATVVAFAAAAVIGGAAGVISARSRRAVPGASPGGAPGPTAGSPGAAVPAAAPAVTAAPVRVGGRWPVTRDEVVLADGRRLQWFAAGPPDAPPLVFHHAAPGSAGAWRGAVGAAARSGHRLVTFSRPGYATSTRRPGRRVVDTAADVAELLAALGARRFATAGWAAGAGHALACAARMPDRCTGVVIVAPMAPAAPFGPGWFDGFEPDTEGELRLAADGGPEALAAALGPVAVALAAASTDAVADAVGAALAEVDQRALAGPVADYLAATVRAGLGAGAGGWVDDDVAAVTPWGFDPVEVTVPVRVVVGGADRAVPPAHGRWLAEHLPLAVVDERPAEGHLSLLADAFDDGVARLATG